MARKRKNTDRYSTHDFTRQIHSSARKGTGFASMNNHNEKEAKEDKKVCCRDCRYFLIKCGQYIGAYHKTCDDFMWW